MARYDQWSFRFDLFKGKDEMQERRRELEGRGDHSLDLLKAKMQDSTGLDAVRAANGRDQGLTAQQIKDLDWKWQASGEELPRRLTDGKCNEFLKLFQKSFEGFAEIFVTGRRGLNACQTNKTTDYYQADEGWWQETFAMGKARRVAPEFDESAKVFALPLYVPVRGPTRGKIIGVAKAVVAEGRC